ncbi:RecX family transcriptional regulator [Patescibacteria group bacterium]|nr:RecX family transcriptional regulator [Patescibacteria group bacterium]
MPKLTKIVAQTVNANRVSLFADGKFLTGLDRFTWSQLNLKSGDELTPQLIARLKSEDTNSKCYDKALKLLSFRPQSSYELRQKLSKRFADDVIKLTLGRLVKTGLVDDEKFAFIWANERLLTRQRSVSHLIAELRQKGIERSIIQSVISKLDRGTELDSAISLAQKSPRKSGEKLRAYLARRGFNYSVIREVERQLQTQK